MSHITKAATWSVGCVVGLCVFGAVGLFLFPPWCLERSKESAAKIQAKNIVSALKLYYVNHGQFPADLTVLTQPDTEFLNGAAYLPPDAVNNPWGQPFQLDSRPLTPPDFSPRVYTTYKGQTYSNENK